MTKRNSLAPGVRFSVLRRDGFRCQYCYCAPPDVILEIDHIVPVAKGGSDDEDNLITACFDCNRGKRDTDLVGCETSPQSTTEVLRSLSNGSVPIGKLQEMKKVLFFSKRQERNMPRQLKTLAGCLNDIGMLVGQPGQRGKFYTYLEGRDLLRRVGSFGVPSPTDLAVEQGYARLIEEVQPYIEWNGAFICRVSGENRFGIASSELCECYYSASSMRSKSVMSRPFSYKALEEMVLPYTHILRDANGKRVGKSPTQEALDNGWARIKEGFRLNDWLEDGVRRLCLEWYDEEQQSRTVQQNNEVETVREVESIRDSASEGNRGLQAG